MRGVFYLLFSATALLVERSIAGYVLQDDYMDDFFGNFDFFTGPDPTEGFVQYVDEATARQSNLINTNSTAAMQWGVDTHSKTPNGRPSVRITSKKSYNSGLIVLDVAHMPFGCGTWPAFWTVGPDWPSNGEIDILEGVHEQTNNGMTLHTGPGCQIGQDTTQFSGSLHTSNCDVAAKEQPANTGCSIQHSSKQSYGAGLNAIGGGVYATQWTAEAISVFFFPRGSVPGDVLGDSPNPSRWGKPAAKFVGGGCDIAHTFKQQQLVFDTTFCGQWAGSQSVWDASSSCAKKAPTCVQYVRENPKAFTEAYWKINALKVYQDDGNGEEYPAPSYPGNDTAVSAYPTVASSSLAEYPAASSSSSSSSSSSYSSPQYATPTDDPTAPDPVPSSYDNEEPDATDQEEPPTPTTPTPTPTRPAPTKSPKPTTGHHLPGFQWPQKESHNEPQNPPEDANSPAQNATAQHSKAPVASPSPSPSPPPPPPTTTTTNASSQPPYPAHTKTVYRTVYETVTAYPDAEPAPSPSPDGKKARMVRREQRAARRGEARRVGRM